MTPEEYINKVKKDRWDRLSGGWLGTFVTEENALAAVELAREEMKESIIKMLDAEKEDTGIGLCEYDMGHENGRMELIDTLKNKLRKE